MPLKETEEPLAASPPRASDETEHPSVALCEAIYDYLYAGDAGVDETDATMGTMEPIITAALDAAYQQGRKDAADSWGERADGLRGELQAERDAHHETVKRLGAEGLRLLAKIDDLKAAAQKAALVRELRRMARGLKQ